MKKLTWLFFLIAFAALNYFGEDQDSPGTEKSVKEKDLYFDGLLRTEISNYNKSADFFIEAELNTDEKFLTVNQKIVWFNKTGSKADELQFHIYPNAFGGNNTTYAKDISIPQRSRTKIEFNKFVVGGKETELIYFSPDDGNPHDSTVAKIELQKPVLPGDSIQIEIKYNLKIPFAIRRFGYSNNFYFISQWFPKPGVFENGEWITNQYHFNTEFFSDFADYKVSIKVPQEYNVAATGVLTSESDESGYREYTFVQKGVHDFAWAAAKNYAKVERTFKSSNQKEVTVEIFYRTDGGKYLDRYFEAVFKSLKFMSENIGEYPYEKLKIIDTPIHSSSAGMEYPALFTVNSELISPEETLYPEKLVVHEFIHQYFYGVAANNETSEAWLDEGLASYFTNKIIDKYYGAGLLNFKLVNYLPVYGMNILSYNEIPIIYFLGEFELPEEAESMFNYYRNPNIGSISDSSYKLPGYLSYAVNSYFKPELMLLSLENYIGEEKFLRILSKYFNRYKFGHPTGKDFISVIQKNSDEDLTWFFKNVYEEPRTFDYKVSGIKKNSAGEYEIMLERLGDGVFHSEIAVYTESDTTFYDWRDDKKWKEIKIQSDEEITAVVIDPERKNLLDINFANNSYTTERKIAAPISLSIRWLFWIQNALMILGSVG